MILDCCSKLSVKRFQECVGHSSKLSLIYIPISHDTGRFGNAEVKSDYCTMVHGWPAEALRDSGPIREST